MAEQDIMTTIYEGLSIKPSPGDSASDLVSAIQSLYDEYKTAYRDEWDRLTANEKIYHGDHWSDTGADGNEPQPVMPIIFSTVENIQSDLMDEYPEAVVTPESSNDEIIGKILTRVVAQNHEACDYVYEYNDLIHDLLVGGYMIQEVGWDPNMNYGFGGAYIRYVSNKNIMFDPLCANIQDGRAVFKVERLPTSWFHQHYPDYADYFSGGSDLVPDDHFTFGTEIESKETNYMILLEAWVRTYDAENHKYAVHMLKIAGGQLLENSYTEKPEGYFMHGMYPFVCTPLYKIKGSPFGYGIVDMFKNPQQYSDKINQILLKNALTAGTNRILVQKGSADLDEIRDFSKQIIEVSNISGITWFQDRPLPAFLMNYMINMHNGIKEEAGSHDFSRGNTKVTQAEQRLAGIDDPDPVKKGKKIAQASRELSAAKSAASQTASEGQKKVDTATADYKSEAAKAKRKNAANQQLVDEYHASKYCSDIERETANAATAAVIPDPTANTNTDANTAQNGIDNIKNGVAQGDNRGFDARGNEIEYELNDEAKETLAQKYMTPEIQAHIAAMMEMPQTIDDNSPERQQYRIAKADEYYDKYQAANKNREAYIVIGPPAAGKSTIADPLVERTGSILIDSDIIKMGDKARGFEGIPEYGDGIGANAVHEESAQIADGIFVKAIAHGDNLVYPKVGGSAKSIRELAQQLKKHGYTTTLILNELPIEKALERNNNRYNETGRLVRPDYLLSVGNKPIKTYLELQGEGVFDGYERYSNDVNRGEAPFRVLEADKERPVVLRRGGSGRQTSDGDIIETGRAGSRCCYVKKATFCAKKEALPRMAVLLSPLY